jgi:plasmid stability protein
LITRERFDNKIKIQSEVDLKNIMIRNVPDEVQAGLRLRAKANGRTTAAEIRAILTAAAKPEGRDFIGHSLMLIGQQFEGLELGLVPEVKHDDPARYESGGGGAAADAESAGDRLAG